MIHAQKWHQKKKKYKTYPGKPKVKKSLKHQNRENHNTAMIVGWEKLESTQMAHNWSNIKSDKLQLNTKTGNFLAN